MSELLKINKKDISEDKGLNTRFDMGDLREIRSNMERNGYSAAFPVIVRNDPKNPTKYILGAQGHRRMAVAWDLDVITEVFAVLEDDSVTDFDRNLDVIRLNTGKELNLLEQSRVAMRALAVEGKTQGEIAKLIGKSEMHMTNLVKLSKLTKQTTSWIEKDKISATEVLAIITKDKLKLSTPEEAESLEAKVEKLIAKAGDKKVTRAKTEKTEREQEETEEEKAAREEEEKDEAEMKVVNKLRMEAGKRAQKFFEKLQEDVVKYNDLPADDKLTPFQESILDYQVALASYLTGVPVDSARIKTDKGEAGKLSDVGAAQRAIEKIHKETVREIETELKAEAKAQVQEVKAQVKTVKAKAAKAKAAK